MLYSWSRNLQLKNNMSIKYHLVNNLTPTFI